MGDGCFAKWQKDGVFAQLIGVLRRLLRQTEGKAAEPSACVIDAQSVRTSTSVPTAGQGTNAAKKFNPARHQLMALYLWRRDGPASESCRTSGAPHG